MKKYRIVWQQCPTSRHPAKVNFVESPDPESAKIVLTDYIERKFGIEWFKLISVHTAEPIPAEKGRVIE